jgi:Fe-S oxidoreductase
MAPANEFPGSVFFYLIILGFGAFFALTIIMRLIPFVQGKRVSRLDHLPARVRDVFLIMLAQGRFFRRKYWYSGILHPLIFWGFMVLLIRSLNLLLDGVSADISLQHLLGNVYTAWRPMMDLFNVLVIVGVSMGAFQRFFIKPERMTINRDGWTILSLIFLLMVTDVLGNSLEIFLERGGKDYFSFFAFGVANLWDRIGMPVGTGEALHATFWFSHLVLLLAFLDYLPYSKHSHVLTVAFNVFFRSSEPTGVLQPLDIEGIMERGEEGATFGVAKLTDFSWKQMMDFLTCTECGRCQANCPAYLTEKELSPKEIQHAGRLALLANTPTMGSILRLKPALPQSDGEPLRPIDTMGFEPIWDCVTCGSCQYWCPVMIEHVPTIIDVRRFLVMDEAQMPETAQAALMQLEQRGHPWRGTPFTRSDWMEGLEVGLFDGSQEYLLWVGCTGALSERNVPITQALAKLLIQAGVSFGVLGEEEPCCGDPARRLGNEYLFQMQAQQAIEVMNAKGVKKIVTACPHGYNVIRNEYKQFNGHFEVVHHSELLAQLVREGKLRPQEGVEQTIVYHDSCYLARHNGIIDAPRQVLAGLPKTRLVEMERSRMTTFCCGAGGGHMWVEENRGEHINNARTREAMATGAGIVATACPFCIQMFEDGIPALEPDEEKRMRALDIAELLEGAVEARGKEATAALTSDLLAAGGEVADSP